MPSIAYDATRAALLNPELRPSLFGPGGPGRPAWPDIHAVSAECSRLAYLHFENPESGQGARLGAALAAAGFSELRTVQSAATGTQAFAVLLAAGGPVLLAFRGTEPDQVTDIGTDLAATLVPWVRGGRVHFGFAHAFASVRDDIGAWLGRHAGGREPVFTGHSLGAALATLAASFWPGGRLVTFGSPRVGDAAFVKTIDLARSARFVDCCDIVAQVPPAAAGLYADSGPMRYIDRHGIERAGISEAAVEDDRAAARSSHLRDEAWVSGNVWSRELADHAPINYVRAFA